MSSGWLEAGKYLVIGVSVLMGWHYCSQPESKVGPTVMVVARPRGRVRVSKPDLKVRLERVLADKAAVAAGLRAAAAGTTPGPSACGSALYESFVDDILSELGKRRVAEHFLAEVDGHVDRTHALERTKLAAPQRLPTGPTPGKPSEPRDGPSFLSSVGRIVVETATRESAQDRTDRALTTLVNRGCYVMEPGAQPLVGDHQVPARYDTSRGEQFGELLATKLPPVANYLFGLQPSLGADDLNRGVSSRNRLAWFVASRVRLEHPNLTSPSTENLKCANLLCSKLLRQMSKGEVETHPEWASMRDCDQGNALKMAVAMIFVPSEGELDAARLLDSREVKRLRSLLEHSSAGRAASARV